MSTSPNTIVGFLPPISSETLLKRGAHELATAGPDTDPPVNEIVFTVGCAVSAAPTSAPTPCTILRTPRGNPAVRQISEKRYAVIGVTSEGLATTVLPV